MYFHTSEIICFKYGKLLGKQCQAASKGGGYGFKETVSRDFSRFYICRRESLHVVSYIRNHLFYLRQASRKAASVKQQGRYGFKETMLVSRHEMNIFLKVLKFETVLFE
jgi:hypothetical protein